MKHAAALLALFLLAVTIGAGAKAQNIHELCGRIEYVQRTPSGIQKTNNSAKRTGLKGLALELYESRADAACCKDLKRVEGTNSGRSGQFRFKPVSDGDYWVSTTWKGKQYPGPVVVRPPTLEEHCSFEGIEIDDKGNAGWFTAVE